VRRGGIRGQSASGGGAPKRPVERLAVEPPRDPRAQLQQPAEILPVSTPML
jgi:hypothetical protein